MKRAPSTLVLALFASALGFASGNASPPSSAAPSPVVTAAPAALPGSVELSIRFYDKRIYYPDGEIAIKVSITNKTASSYSFRLAENRMFSLSFDVRTPSNRRLDPALAFKQAIASAGPAYYRDITVEPGEEYSFVEDLAAYTAFTEAGSYAIQASFWPALAPRGQARTAAEPLLSNVLMLSLRPSPAGSTSLLASIRAETGELLQPQVLPPDEVVKRTIEARQRSHWNEFFLYLDLEALLKRSPELARAYARESDEGRRLMLERFRGQLETGTAEVAIVTLPREFTILETRYTADDGFVSVIERFQEKGFVSVKEYEYELRRRADIWYIVGYSVLNKGTE